MRPSYLLAAFALASCAAPPPPAPNVTKASSMSLDVQFEGARYVAVASICRFRDGHDDSCVILIPDWKHPSLRFDFEYGVNSVCLSGHRFRFRGRYVGVTNRSGNSLTLLAELPRGAFKDFDSFKVGLPKLLSGQNSRSNQTLQPTAGWCTVSRQVTNTHPFHAVLALASGG
jgi:hypothetical protein